ncbi:hypothetical protein HJG53_00685 [Sphingomonas sp. ID1715]|uniref:hypothetical protein n=1 Tax=Sphingomonas sp. ID1715 TaxID=1656898 RepID=UPI00148828A5|nr:hypothetical protein [Sphingomonas sp. ID1715]NNM75425.1 hypothetical protein [Sphingomonas sp. ID1715]
MLTGLIVAGEEAADGACLRAELPVAGQTVMEHQARLIAEAGAARIIVIAERLSPMLAQAVARLRADGLAIEVVRQVDDVAQRVQTDERILLLADGVVSDLAAIERILATPAPAVLVLADAADTRGWELIDANARWAGLLLADGELVRRTARMLGEWELQSTLLRNAVQSGASRVPVEGVAILARVDDPAAAQLVEQAISRGAARRPTGLLDRYLFEPVARLLAPKAMHAMIDPAWLRTGSAGLLGLSALLLLSGWRWPALLAALFSGPLDSLGRHLGALSLRLRRDQHRAGQLRLAAAAAAQLALGWNLRDYGWGSIALSIMTLGLVSAAFEHERWVGKAAPRPLWLAETDLLIWLMLPFGLAGWWVGGLAVQAAVAFASLLALQRLTRRQS